MANSEIDWGELMAMKPGSPIPESIAPQLAEKIGCFRMLNEQDKASRDSEKARLRFKALIAMPPGSPIPHDISPEAAWRIEWLREKHAADMADCEDIIASKPSKQVELAPQHPEAIRQRVIDELMWSIDQAKMHNDHASVANYASMLLPFVRMG